MRHRVWLVGHSQLREGVISPLPHVKFEPVINQGTAKLLGMSVSAFLLSNDVALFARCDESGWLAHVPLLRADVICWFRVLRLMPQADLSSSIPLTAQNLQSLVAPARGGRSR